MKLLQSLICQYPASISTDSPTKGVKDVVARLTQLDKECPDTKFAIVGYSQGAAVMHGADSSIPKSIRPKILAAVMFGDPSKQTGTGYFTNIPTLEVCNDGNAKSLPDPVSNVGLKLRKANGT
jgi:hypothetical protein